MDPAGSVLPGQSKRIRSWAQIVGPGKSNDELQTHIQVSGGGGRDLSTWQHSQWWSSSVWKSNRHGEQGTCLQQLQI